MCWRLGLYLRNLHTDMRGQQLFQDLFELPKEPITGPGKGRNGELDEQRNDLLLHRYYFYGHFTDLRYHKIMRRMNREFFLSERRLLDVIQAHTAKLHDIRQCQPSLMDLQRKWPHFIWKSEK